MQVGFAGQAVIAGGDDTEHARIHRVGVGLVGEHSATTECGEHRNNRAHPLPTTEQNPHDQATHGGDRNRFRRRGQHRHRHHQATVDVVVHRPIRPQNVVDGTFERNERVHGRADHQHIHQRSPHITAPQKDNDAARCRSPQQRLIDPKVTRVAGL